MSQHEAALDSQPERRYEYRALPDRHFFRYLTLQPASIDTDPLVCTLHTAHLDDAPPFEAISYAWGTPVRDHLITCDGRASRITANLSEALRQVRPTERPRTLWVDSICINQADAKEQAHQVSLMGRVFSKSKCTLICLGARDGAHAPVVEDLVARIGALIRPVFEREDFGWSPNSFPFPDNEEPLLSHAGWDAFGVLLRQPWFGRGWVVQEAALARDARVLWAGAEMGWLEVVRAYVWGGRRALMFSSSLRPRLSDLHLQGFYARRNREAATFRPEGAVEPAPLLEMLDCARRLGVSDPRDRIYAFLSLPHVGGTLAELRPSYETPYLHAYRDFACEYVGMGGDLDILQFVHNDDGALGCDFPSWIPRWNLCLYSRYPPPQNDYTPSSSPVALAASSFKATVSTDEGTLGVRGILIDSVAFASRTFDTDSTIPDDVVSLWESVSTRSVALPYSCSALRAFVTIFRCGVYRGRLEEWVRLESAYMRLLRRELPRRDVSYKAAEEFHRSRMDDVHNRSFVLTHRGYYGLAPGVAREGDVCCVIFGTMSPFILRRTGRAGYYKLVGPVLILSKEPDHNGYPSVLGRDEKREDWTSWGLEEEDVVLV